MRGWGTRTTKIRITFRRLNHILRGPSTIRVPGNPPLSNQRVHTRGTKRPNHGTNLKFKQSPSDFFHLKKPPFIIEMAENGILDYQGMNQAIYRGATSNIIVDTQSMSIEIGAGNSSHTSNLHIECDHDANVASIQLNSNVVTEFSRSKSLLSIRGWL